MNLKTFLSSVVLIGLISCDPKADNQTAKDTSEAKLMNLAGQVFFFAPELDTTECVATGACDCCASHCLFLDESNFILISYCDSDEEYFSGTYKIDGNKVFLHYSDKKVVSELKEDMNEEIQDDYVVYSEKAEASNVTFTTFNCRGQMLLKIEDEIDYYGSLDKEVVLDQQLQELKDSGVWEKLK
jgi:hypothetical protein